MDAILNQLGEAIGAILGNPVLQLGLRLAFAYLVIVWLAAAWWTFRDMHARTENAALPYVAASFVVLFTPLLFPFAIAVYRVVRPPETIGEAHERQLTAIAMEVDLATSHCPECERIVDTAWIACPGCGRRLNHRCAECGNVVGLDWRLCAWCGDDLAPGVLTPRLVTDRAALSDAPEPGLERARRRASMPRRPRVGFGLPARPGGTRRAAASPVTLHAGATEPLTAD